MPPRPAPTPDARDGPPLTGSTVPERAPWPPAAVRAAGCRLDPPHAVAEAVAPDGEHATVGARDELHALGRGHGVR